MFEIKKKKKVGVLHDKTISNGLPLAQNLSTACLLLKPDVKFPLVQVESLQWRQVSP